jgi:hypothetical protein
LSIVLDVCEFNLFSFCFWVIWKVIIGSKWHAARVSSHEASVEFNGVECLWVEFFSVCVWVIWKVIRGSRWLVDQAKQVHISQVWGSMVLNAYELNIFSFCVWVIWKVISGSKWHVDQANPYESCVGFNNTVMDEVSCWWVCPWGNKEPITWRKTCYNYLYWGGWLGCDQANPPMIGSFICLKALMSRFPNEIHNLNYVVLFKSL